MAFVNIYQLGDVELFWAASLEGARQPLSSLPSGTVTVVDGVIQCRNLPENLGGAGVGYIIAVPQNPLKQAGTARVRALPVAIGGGWDVGSSADIQGGVSAADIPNLDNPPVDFDPLFNQALSAIVALDPEQQQLGDVPVQSSPLPQLVFGYTESGGV